MQIDLLVFQYFFCVVTNPNMTIFCCCKNHEIVLSRKYIESTIVHLTFFLTLPHLRCPVTENLNTKVKKERINTID